MEYWEFLLQQEGDSNWLPLDSSQMEILEGRYRIMAHCSQAHIPVNIHISQLLTDQIPPRRRSLKKQRQTSENGLMVVLPFTRLTSGTWDVYCQGVAPPDVNTGDGASDQSSSSWQYAIQLRVLPKDAGEDGDWFADDGSSHSLAAEQNLSSEIAEARDIDESRIWSATPTAWPNLDLPQVAEVLDRAQDRFTATDSAADFLYALTINQTALMAAQGQPIQLTGQARGVVDGESCSDMALVVRLSNPQSAEVLTLAPFALTDNVLPATFSLTIALPESPSTRLLLGELALVSWQASTINLLALQRFTVTVDLAALFDEIANRAETEADDDLVFAPDKLTDVRASPDQRPGHHDDDRDVWANINFPEAPPRSVPVITLPRSSAPIPPKIYYPSPHEVSAHTPVLPPLGKPKSAPAGQGSAPQSVEPAAADAAAQPSGDAAGQDLSPDASAVSAAARQAAVTAASLSPELRLPPLKSPISADLTSAGEALSDPGADPLATLAPVDDPASPLASRETRLLPSHETMAFKALNLQERFWTRLNDLAVTIQQQAEQQQVEAEAQTAIPPEDEAAVAPPFIPFEGEVVIYEDAGPLAAEELTVDQAAELVSRLEQEKEAEIVTPPMPEIEIAPTELIAGETVLLTLRVPFHPNRLYIKVWITDPQTRNLADEPRQINHLSPNGRGQLEGTIQLTVPMGCLEAWFEAIAVDMVTQQESYKASVSRSINPLGIESPSQDEFEL